jgi:predicted RNA-binding Zn-ribbon protein involved in translation (DUF1610 family)
MATELRQTLGTWWRFTRYEIVNGYIQPHDDARLQSYNPWEEFQASRATTGTPAQQPPYASLLSLAETVKALPNDSGGVDLDRASEAAILEWCSHHGLLGLLTSLVRSVVLAPRLVDKPWAGHGPVFCTYDHYAGGWRIRYRTTTGYTDETRESYENQRIDFEKGTPLNTLHPEWQAHLIRHRRLTDQALLREPLDSLGAVFYPIVKEENRTTFPYFVPTSVESWLGYAEPLTFFLEAANVFRRMVDLLAHSPHRVRDDVERLGRTFLNPQGLEDLESLMAPIKRTVAYMEGERQEVWVAPSLLSSYAAMFCEDWVRRRPRRCEECGKIFVSGQRNVKYDSPRCRNTALKRVYRHRRAKRESRGSKKR